MAGLFSRLRHQHETAKAEADAAEARLDEALQTERAVEQEAYELRLFVARNHFAERMRAAFTNGGAL